jgi:hypothetical protein
VTNTYFEGQSKGNTLGAHGHSKEKRTDCPLVTLQPCSGRYFWWTKLRRLLSSYDQKELRSYLEYCLQQAGAPQLMTKPLMTTLVEHSAGNLRLLNVMAAELLTVATQRELTQLDEQLFLELYSPTLQKRQSR